MDPEASAVHWDGDLGWSIDDDEFAGLFQAGDHFSDVDVQMALGADFGSVDRNAPVGAPEFLCLVDGGGPEFGALGGRHMFQFHHAAGVFAGQDQQAIGFARIHVFEVEIVDAGGLFLGFARERALPRRHGLAGRYFAGASSGGLSLYNLKRKKQQQ